MKKILLLIISLVLMIPYAIVRGIIGFYKEFTYEIKAEISNVVEFVKNELKRK